MAITSKKRRPNTVIEKSRPNHKRRETKWVKVFERIINLHKSIGNGHRPVVISTLSIALLGIFALIAYLIFSSGLFKIKRILVQGNVSVAEEEVRRYAAIEPGINIFKLNLKQTAERVKKHPWIRSVNISRRLPGDIHLHVTERQPVLLAALRGLHLVDKDGTVFSRARPGVKWSLPVITGLAMEEIQSRKAETRKLILDALRLIALFKASAIKKLTRLSEIAVNAKHGPTIYTDDPVIGIRVGKGNYAKKFEQLSQILPRLKKRGVRAREIMLDLLPKRNRITVRVAQWGAKGKERLTIP